jgi:hypothetical protein
VGGVVREIDQKTSEAAGRGGLVIGVVAMLILIGAMVVVAAPDPGIPLDFGELHAYVVPILFLALIVLAAYHAFSEEL